MQLTARIKRNEDIFNDEHQSAVSANASVRGLEQQIAAVQKEYILRRDAQTMRYKAKWMLVSLFMICLFDIKCWWNT